MYTNRLRPETAHSPSCRAPSNSTAKATGPRDRKSTRLNSSHSQISYAVFCLKKKINPTYQAVMRLVGDFSSTERSFYHRSDIDHAETHCLIQNPVSPLVETSRHLYARYCTTL